MDYIHKHNKVKANAAGHEPLPYKTVEACCGGPIDGAAKGSGIGAGQGVDGSAKVMLPMTKPATVKVRNVKNAKTELDLRGATG